MSPRFASLLVVCFFTLTPVLAESQQNKINVYVDHTGSDPVGQRLTFALREAVRASRGYELASAGLSFVHVSLVTLDPDSSTSLVGNSTVVSVVITMQNPGWMEVGNQRKGSTTWYPFFLTSKLVVVGSNRVDESARGILATLDAAVVEFRAATQK